MQVLIRKGRKQWLDSLIVAAQHGNNEALKILLDAGADKEGRSNSGHTALMLAAQEGKNEVLKILLKSGANIDVKTNYGDSALQYAIR